MSILKLYHGSTRIIQAPTYGVGNVHNDYGQGFYCTEDLDLACEWACTTGENGHANAYTIDTEGLRTIDLNDGSFNILNWMALLLANRSFDTAEGLAARAKAFILERYLPDTADVDMIKGYRADDSYFTFAKDFIQGSLSLERLEVALRLGKLGEQVMIKSERAFNALRFEEAVPVRSSEWHPRYLSRDMAARRGYQSLRSSGAPELDTYIIDIIRNGGI